MLLDKMNLQNFRKRNRNCNTRSLKDRNKRKKISWRVIWDGNMSRRQN